jgi:Putative prokaryotic signal transducing protein
MSQDLVTIYVPGDICMVGLVKSMLESEGIPCLVKNEGLQSVFGYGIIGAGYNPILGPMEVQVPRELEELALEVLRPVLDGSPIEDD